MMKITKFPFVFVLQSLTAGLAAAEGEPEKQPEKLRVIMSSDFPPIGVVKGGNAPNHMKSDPDDMQSMVRFLLYANEFDIEGLVASAGTFAMEAHKKNILEVLDEYEKVHGNLIKHDPEDPTQPSWGGQYKRKPGTNHHVDGPGGSSISKWRKDDQKEFQERADWMLPTE